MYKVAIVVSKFNEIITQNLQKGAENYFTSLSDVQFATILVPGAFELPIAAQWLVSDYDGVLALGAVIKGTTDHYNYVCNTVSSGLMNVQLKANKPISFGVLTCDTMEQAFDRCGGKLGNKGTECAKTLYEMLTVKHALGLK